LPRIGDDHGKLPGAPIRIEDHLAQTQELLARTNLLGDEGQGTCLRLAGELRRPLGRDRPPSAKETQGHGPRRQSSEELGEWSWSSEPTGLIMSDLPSLVVMRSSRLDDRGMS
jgi:hypothetical protein